MKTIRQSVTIKASPHDGVVQTAVPDQHYASIKQGWIEYYWKPMKGMLEKKKA